MKPHPRIRKTIKWGGAAVTVLLVVVWVASGWFSAMRVQSWGPSSCSSCWVSQGVIGFGHDSIVYYSTNIPPPKSEWFLETTDFALELTPRWGTWAISSWQQQRLLTIPIWFLAAIVGLTTSFAWRLDTLARRRAKLNLCPKCGYDRTGLVGGQDAKCPECGAVPTSAAA